ncbi:MAG: PorT family protein [Flavobacteriales bacterium]|nr:PorT family protein [Flavobacteriales bacterium]
MRSLVAIAIGLIAQPILAQENAQQPPFPEGKHGPRLGLCLATQSTGGLFSNTTDMLLGPMVGWHFDVPVHWQVSIMPEVLWLTKGYVVRNPALGVRNKTTFRYLEVPLLVKVSTDKAAEGMFLLFGPSAGYFLSGRTQTWLNGEQNTDFRYDLSQNERRLQFSIVIGMGMDGKRWSFDVRAQTSVTPFDPVARIQNQVYAITAAYRLGGKKPDAPEEDAE